MSEFGSWLAGCLGSQLAALALASWLCEPRLHSQCELPKCAQGGQEVSGVDHAGMSCVTWLEVMAP